MKELLILPILLASAITSGCVVKTSSSGDPASPASNTAPASNPSPAAAPASPAPATAAATPASAPAKTASTPVAMKQPADPKKADTPASAQQATPAPNPATKTDTAAAKTPQPAFSPPPKPKAQPKERKADEANGVPPNMKPGARRAFWIWRDKDGVTWHVRTTTKTELHRFSGRIWVDGTIQDLKPSRLETQDRLKMEDAGIVVFDFTTQGVMDGFDFKVAAGRCVTFHLLIDGKPEPKEVEIGEKEVAAGSPTFRLCQ